MAARPTSSPRASVPAHVPSAAAPARPKAVDPAKAVCLLKFFEEADLCETWNNMALIESDMYRHPNGAYCQAVAYEATDSSCWYVFEGETRDVKQRTEKLNQLRSHAEATGNFMFLSTRVETRADAMAAIKEHNARYEREGYSLFRKVNEIRTFKGRSPQPAA